MKYVIYKMYFFNGVHFGSNTLESSQYTFLADTLFSALCQEAVKMGQEKLDELISCTKGHQILLSDAFPVCEDELFLPKPFLYIDRGEKAGDSVVKKAYKKMKYISLNNFDKYLRGNLLPEEIRELNDFGYVTRKVSASVRGEENTVPYRVGVYYYHEGNGIYFIAGVASDDAEMMLDELLECLSYSGIGGKRSSGLGRFDLFKTKCPEELSSRLQKEAKHYMTLSVSLPQEHELSDAMHDANYSVIKRSGFVASERYADEHLRKHDLYVFSAGSCFLQKFNGDIFDVSSKGKHPVYRYAVPMFMGVEA